jgi:2-polyprenyl-3-methyl-5-hydroxy-6-metoxy-1,4-benzoquinol methylase
MLANNSDKEWEKLGKTQPYYGVISHAPYAAENLNPEAIRKFFDTGEDYVKMIFDQVKARVHSGFAPRRALDFGCGVGRLVIPMASRCGHVTGVDISPSMLKEARKNSVERGVANVDYHAGLDAIEAGVKFDFIHTFIVMQHIPLKKGMPIFRSMLERLAPGGCGAIHMTYRYGGTGLKALVYALRKKFQAFNLFYNLLKGVPLGTPFMQMNAYDMNRVMWMMQQAGCREFHSLFTYHGIHAGQILLFRKPESPEPYKA